MEGMEGGVELLTDQPGGGILYAIGVDDARALWNQLPSRPSALAAVSVADWNRELSPWPAEKCFKGGQAFGGEADAFLERLTREIIPQTEAGRTFAWRAIAGYSLAGLFALYALYQAPCFDAALSASGSLWFDGWMEYMRGHEASPKTVYLSLGSREEHTKNARLAAVGDCTREAEQILRAQGVNVTLEMNEGGHFVDANERLAKGIHWLMNQPFALKEK